MPTFVRAATQFACRVQVLGDRECKLLIRATRNSDEVRNTVAKRRPARTTARRLVRGSPHVANFEDFWPGKRASSRPPASLPGGEPQADPGKPQQKFVMLNADASVHARKLQYRDRACPPPTFVAEVFDGRPARVPRCPLREIGLPRPELKVLFGDESHADWWGAEFELGRAPSDSKFRAAWRGFFESFASIERGFAPAYRLLIKNRAADSRGSRPAVSADASAMAFRTVAPPVELGVTAQEMGGLLRAFVGSIPLSAVHVIAERDELVGQEGTLGPLGVIAGMVFATVARA